MQGAQERLKQTATDVAHTATEHAREVGEEVGAEARHLVGEVRQRLADEAGSQSDRLSNSLRQLSDDLGGMRGAASNDSLASAVVQRLSEGSRQIADYLEQQGPEGVAREVREFARRKPGTFLLSAAAAGFVVGRLGKGVLAGGSNGSGGTEGSTPRNRRTPAMAAAPLPGTGPATPVATPPAGTGMISPPDRTDTTTPVATPSAETGMITPPDGAPGATAWQDRP